MGGQPQKTQFKKKHFAILDKEWVFFGFLGFSKKGFYEHIVRFYEF